MHSTLQELTFDVQGYRPRRVAIAVVVYSRWYLNSSIRRIWRKPLAVHSLRPGIEHAQHVHLEDKSRLCKNGCLVLETCRDYLEMY